MPARPTARGIALQAAMLALSGLCLASTSGCLARPEPGPAEMRTSAPPWPAPRDAVSYIAAAGLTAEPYASGAGIPRTLQLSVHVDGVPVTIPANVGVDLARAIQAAAHTHDDTGLVTLEGAEAETVTLGQFFILWGLRFDANCLGAYCGDLDVAADGRRVADPSGLRLAGARTVAVTVGG